MIAAGILFLIGVLIGVPYGYPAIFAASVAVTIIAFSVWLIRGEFGLFVVLVWIGYLFALQAGFLLGGYLGLSGKRGGLPEPDRPPGDEAKPRPPQNGQAGPEQNSHE